MEPANNIPLSETNSLRAVHVEFSSINSSGETIEMNTSLKNLNAKGTTPVAPFYDELHFANYE